MLMVFKRRKNKEKRRRFKLRTGRIAMLLLFILLLAIGIWYADAPENTPAAQNKDNIDNQKKEEIKEAPALPQYYIKAFLDDKNYLIQGELELTANNPGTEKLLFYAYPDWSPIRIKGVKLNDKAAPHVYEGKNLTFANEKESPEIKVQISFETPVPTAGTRFGVKDDIWLITTWYPLLGVLDENKEWIKRPDPRGMGDPFYFHFADYKVEWIAAEEIKWLSSGQLKSEEAEVIAGEGESTRKTGRQKTLWEVKQVNNFALVGSPGYIIERFKLNDKTTVSVALTEKSKMNEVLQIARDTFPLYSKIYGELPYTDVAIAETSYGTNYALEYPNLAIYSKDMYARDRIRHWIPHEVGHIWWYNAVGTHETVDGWIDEGLAEHGVVWYLENSFSKDKADQLWNQYRSENKKLIAQFPDRTMDVGLYGFYNFQEFDYSWYSRSADMFLTLRQALGDEQFVRFLNNLYSNNLGKVVDENSLNEALADSLGLQTDFFAQWLRLPYEQTTWNVHFNKVDSPEN